MRLKVKDIVGSFGLMDTSGFNFGRLICDYLELNNKVVIDFEGTLVTTHFLGGIFNELDRHYSKEYLAEHVSIDKKSCPKRTLKVINLMLEIAKENK